MLLVNYSGLTVAQDTQLRKELREAGVTYKVYKNTMMNFAFQEQHVKNCANIWMEQNALAISKEDATALQESLQNLQKQLRSWNW